MHILEFVVIHNGILTNFKDLTAFLKKRGFTFESETDTETIPKLLQHLYDTHNKTNDTPLPFQVLIENAVQQLVWKIK